MTATYPSYSPGFEFQGGSVNAGIGTSGGKQPDPFMTYGWTCQVLAVGTTYCEGTNSSSGLIAESGSAGVTGTYAVVDAQKALFAEKQRIKIESS